jgi:hypothetical protein
LLGSNNEKYLKILPLRFTNISTIYANQIFGPVQ